MYAFGGRFAAALNAKPARRLDRRYAGPISPPPTNAAVTVDFFDLLPPTPLRNSYILQFTNWFSRHADMYAVFET